MYEDALKRNLDNAKLRNIWKCYSDHIVKGWAELDGLSEIFTAVCRIHICRKFFNLRITEEF